MALLLGLLALTSCSNGGGHDTVPPELLSSEPAHGAVDVPVDAPLVLHFSEPLDPSLGQVLMSPLGEVSAATDGAWDPDRRVWRHVPENPLPYNTPITVALEKFRDRAGNELASTLFGFKTVPLVDASAPRVIASSPREGERGVSPLLAEIRLSFDEAMDPTQGQVAITGGRGSLGEPRWTTPLELAIAVSGLEADRAYRLVLSDLADPAGQPLDGRSYLVDSALDFSTAASVVGSTSCNDAAVITSSGAISLLKVSSLRADAPSCLPSGAVDWFRYRVQGGGVQISGEPSGALGLVDAGSSHEVGCAFDAQLTGLGRLAPVGTELCIAVPTSTGATRLEIRDRPPPLDGVRGTLAPVGLPPPREGWADTAWIVAGHPLLLGLERGTVLAVSSTVAREGTITAVHSDGSTWPVAVGLPDGAVFAVDAANRDHIVRLRSPGGQWRSEPWDEGTTYRGTVRALTFDGVRLIYAVSTSTSVELFALAPAAPAVPVWLGGSDELGDVVGLAPGGAFFHVLGRLAGQPGLYRLPRARVASGHPPVSLVDGPLELDPRGTHLAIDDVGLPRYLYFKSGTSVRAVFDPSGSAPLVLGGLATAGRPEDRGMAYDPTSRVVFLFDTATSTAGRLLTLR